MLVTLVPAGFMSTLRDFIAALVRAGKNCAEIQYTMKAAYGDQSLKNLQFTMF